MKKILFMLLAGIFTFQLISCKTATVEEIRAQIKEENDEFLKPGKKVSETFRVLLTSDEYKVVQLNHEKSIERVKDEGGDKYISCDIEKLDMIDDVRTGLVSVWLYPDSGSIMKIRSMRPSYFKEVDSLINDDIMRWNFKFPKKVVEPTRFDIYYRVVLAKKKTDEEIIKAVQDKMKGGD
jgi:signal recognition particle subunit SEC65